MDSKKKFNWKLWSMVVGIVVVLGALGWLGYTVYQQNQTLSEQADELARTKSDLALAQASPAPTATPTATPVPSATPLASGAITGTLGYPGGSAPAQTVCAVKTTDATVKYCTNNAGSAAGSLVYTISVPAGSYYVYSSLQAAQGSFTTDYKAYYNKYVTCGNASSCPAADHKAYIVVTVKGIQTVKDVNPTDWYAL